MFHSVHAILCQEDQGVQEYGRLAWRDATVMLAMLALRLSSTELQLGSLYCPACALHVRALLLLHGCVWPSHRGDAVTCRHRRASIRGMGMGQNRFSREHWHSEGMAGDFWLGGCCHGTAGGMRVHSRQGAAGWEGPWHMQPCYTVPHNTQCMPDVYYHPQLGMASGEPAAALWPQPAAVQVSMELLSPEATLPDNETTESEEEVPWLVQEHVDSVPAARAACLLAHIGVTLHRVGTLQDGDIGHFDPASWSQEAPCGDGEGRATVHPTLHLYHTDHHIDHWLMASHIALLVSTVRHIPTGAMRQGRDHREACWASGATVADKPFCVGVCIIHRWPPCTGVGPGGVQIAGPR